ncbi:MAG: hypothetical protein ACI9LV_000592, partial [Candidatus Nanohaloarchaea archaeon]
MKGPKFILSRLKENFDVSEEEEQEGFPDMNYLIGNSSAMDIGEVPTPMDERIGYAAQVGGSVMELQITNPATFTLERDAMISTIDQLGIDVTLHSDMNAGYTTAYKTGAGESYGYDTVEQYFTEYLQELAGFKKEVERRGNGEPLFNIGRINPHISTSPLPALNERMAQDVAVDPFGFEINDYDENARKQRNKESRNIYKNPEFLRKLYHTLFLEVSNYPFQQYQTFASYSNEFDQEWLKAQHRAAEKLLKKETDTLDDIIGTILTARRQDQGIESAWLELIDDKSVGTEVPIYEIEFDTEGEDLQYSIDKKGSFSGIKETLTALTGSDSPGLASVGRAVNQITEFNVESIIINDQTDLARLRNSGKWGEIKADINSRIDREEISTKLESSIREALIELWGGNGGGDPDKQYISQDAKWNALQSHLEIQQIRIFENAYNIGREEYDIEELAEDVFSGADMSLFDAKEREHIEDAEEMHEDMLERLLTGQQFQREMWKESKIFYQIIPAWMSSSSNDSHENHQGWDAPEFIWETVIESKWGEKEDIDLDLTDPRNGVDGGDNHFMDLLENDREFQMDVAAAVGACYAWAHFTQRKNRFDLKGRDFGLSQSEQSEVENKGWTWMKWMNRFGIGVNLETMAGGPQQKFKIWRPKDIAVTAHAINMTARKELDELNDEIDGRPAKFTIDMEHVATMGAPPMKEMERFFDQEDELAEERPELEIDEDKPVAKVLRQMHLMDPGVEGQRGTYHGAFDRGNKQLYEWLYRFVEKGFTRNENEPGTVLFELAEHKGESSYMMRITMNMIELGIKPEEVTPDNVDPSRDEYKDEREALIARFFGMDKANYSKEWAKIEEHAFDPLEGLLEA